MASAPSTAAAYLGRARDTARENLTEARSLVAALTPPDLVGTSLPEALRRLVERFDGHTSPLAGLSVTGTPRALPTEHEVALLRSVQESLTNAHRHAGAAQVEVALMYAPDRVSLRVSDNGNGFDPTVPRQGYGLSGIRARVQAIGGAATIESAPGAGVVVRIDLPLTGG